MSRPSPHLVGRVGRLAGALALPAALLWGAPEAHAEGEVRRFAPSPLGAPHLTLDGADALGARGLSAGGRLVFERRPLIYYRDGERTEDIIGHRVHLDLNAAYGVFNGLDVGVALPLVLDQDGEAFAGGALDDAALADPTFAVRVALLDRFVDGLGLALTGRVTAPLGDGEALAGEPGPTGDLRLAASFALARRVDLGVNAGYRLRAPFALADVQVDDELMLGVGLLGRWTPSVSMLVEMAAAAAAAAPFAEAEQTPGEADLAVRWTFWSDTALVVGVGAGLLPGYGSPQWRVFVGLDIAPVRGDFDGDRIADRADRCPEVPGVRAEQGCPAPVLAHRTEVVVEKRSVDQDDDGVLDVSDQCPLLAEDRDGFRDDDGCPDDDNDLDLLADRFDADPLGPEDWDGFEDADGIPDLDNDRDGVADFRDACPNEPGGPDGCGDPLPAATPGAEGLAVASGPAAPLVLGRTLHPARPILFAFANPALDPESGPLLDGLAAYLRAHPELRRVEVGVHVDAMGSRRWKHWLSWERALSVTAALVDRGVESARLVPRGYGPDVPVQTNATKQGRFENRRVELRVMRPFEQPARRPKWSLRGSPGGPPPGADTPEEPPRQQPVTRPKADENAPIPLNPRPPRPNAALSPEAAR
ncbi:MAG: OmpA family protein [Myxococcales bacterium]|nr:OmpA family protein [Myxococcales bacterium]